jgi:hypothetical protein
MLNNRNTVGAAHAAATDACAISIEIDERFQEAEVQICACAKNKAAPRIKCPSSPAKTKSRS